MSDATDIHDDDAWLAAEHALGLTEGARRTSAEQRVAADPAFRAEVDGWAERLAPLWDEFAPVTPRPELWAAIRARLDAEGAGAAGRPARRAAGGGMWRSVGVWRAASAVLAAACLVLAVVAFRPEPAPVTPAAPTPQPLLAASLAGEDGPEIFAVLVDKTRRQVVAIPLGPQWSDARARELWVIPADGRPRAVGLIGHRPTPIPLPPELNGFAVDSVTFAVSDEPPGGAPGPAPTGPVVATGALSQL